ncbi:citrate synthase family domain protein [Burkholderia thailandensis]|uniref:Citrate synthase family domain protein n=1 Tax=Burkholderia thailandensis TaxID=57975 RepID=A0AAW9CYN6_BURTH|nr:citrate synthase family domain protein [Burkholderia thailandensis]MDW9255021.1 citrate synthase family domain protein [Burkholderia thailandensis]
MQGRHRIGIGLARANIETRLEWRADAFHPDCEPARSTNGRRANAAHASPRSSVRPSTEEPPPCPA